MGLGASGARNPGARQGSVGVRGPCLRYTTPLSVSAGRRADCLQQKGLPITSPAEFVTEEPVKPEGRKRKPQPATLSVLEWAMELEQARKKEPLGAWR